MKAAVDFLLTGIGQLVTADPGMGIVRHADAGYPEALAAAERLGVRIPMREPS